MGKKKNNSIEIKINRNVFNDVYIPFLYNDKRTEIYYGGAGSGKSVFVAQKMIIKWLQGGHNILIVRKTMRTNRKSTFALIRQILSFWKIDPNWYEVNRSELVVTNKINHSQIIFAGLDDVEKLKSITFETGILTDIWVEEANEITESDYNQLDLRLRGRCSVSFQITMTFNPVSALSWIKKRFFDQIDESVSILKTTYKDNKFIDEEYKKKLESLKDIDPVYYKIYAIGDWGVIGNLIFSNYIIEEFDIERFSDFLCGIDFGFNHPSACLKIAESDDDIFICDEIYERGLTNSDLIEMVDKRFGKGYRICADSAEPDRILEFRRAGFNIYASVKGKDSVKHGLDWLKRRRIHIHKKNCPNTAAEIQTFKYREDRDGNVLEEPVDFKNDAMSALRYGIEHLRHERAEVKAVSFGKRTW